MSASRADALLASVSGSFQWLGAPSHGRLAQRTAGQVPTDIPSAIEGLGPVIDGRS
jgi:hypothetical protein